MKWRNTKFTNRETAEQCKNDLKESGIVTGEIFLDSPFERIWFVLPWQPRTRKQLNQGYAIIGKYIP